MFGSRSCVSSLGILEDDLLLQSLRISRQYHWDTSPLTYSTHTDLRLVYRAYPRRLHDWHCGGCKVGHRKARSCVSSLGILDGDLLACHRTHSQDGDAAWQCSLKLNRLSSHKTCWHNRYVEFYSQIKVTDNPRHWRRRTYYVHVSLNRYRLKRNHNPAPAEVKSVKPAILGG